MSALSAEVYLSPEAEAERLWSGAREAYRKARQSIVDLSEAIDLGVRVVEIMTVRGLQPVRKEFPSTITSLLESPPPPIGRLGDVFDEQEPAVGSEYAMDLAKQVIPIGDRAQREDRDDGWDRPRGESGGSEVAGVELEVDPGGLE